MSGPAQIDFSSIGGQPVASGGIDFSSVGGTPVQQTPTQPTTTAPQPQQDSLGSRIWQGVRQSAAGQIWDTAIAPPQNSTEAHVAMFTSQQGLATYRAAKNIVTSVENSVKQTGDKYIQTGQDLARVLQDFQNKDYRNLASSVVSSAADLNDPTGRVRELSEGARPGGNLATPITKDVVDAGLAAMGGEAADSAEAEESVAAAKPNLVQKIAKGEKVVQEPATQTVSKTAGTVAKNAGVEAPAGNPVNSFGDLGDSVLAKAKSQYQQLDEATGGRFQRFQDRLDNIHDKLSELTGTEEDVQQEAKLLKAQKDTEDAMNDAFEDAKAQGVDPQMVDDAKEDYRTGNALKDLDTQVFRSRVVEATDTAGQSNLVNPAKLLPRLQQMYKSGRLTEAMGGDEGDAQDLLQQTKDFSIQGVKAARIQERAGAIGKFAGKTLVGGLLGGAAAGLGYELVKQ